MKLKTQVIYFGARQGTPRLCMLVRTHAVRQKIFLYLALVSMYTTRFVYKNGGTPNAKTCGAPTQSKKIRTSPSSLLFLKSDIHLPIISNEKRGSCFLRLHSSISKEQENLVHFRTVKIYKELFRFLKISRS